MLQDALKDSQIKIQETIETVELKQKLYQDQVK